MPGSQLLIAIQARDEAERVLKSIGPQISALNTHARAAAGGAEQLSGALAGVGHATVAPIKGIGGMIEGLGKLGMGVFGIKALGEAVTSLAGGLVSGNAEFERYTVQFGVLLGSADKAKDRLEELAKFGAETPFELPEVVRADKVLTAFGLDSEDTAKRFGVSAAQIRTTIGDVASGTGASFEELSVTFGKFASGATGEAIARFQEMGIATREQMASWGLEFSKSGELLTPAREAFTVLEQHVRDKFGGMMKAQSGTFEGMMSNVSDWMGQAKRQMMAPLFEVLKDKLSGVLDFLNSDTAKNALKSFSEGIADGLSKAIDFITRFGTAVGPTLINIGKWFLDLAGRAQSFFVELSQNQQVQTLIHLLGGLAEGIARAVGIFASGDIGGGFEALGKAASDWLLPLASNIMGILSDLGGKVLGWLGEQIGPLAAMLGEWATAFLGWIGPMIPPLLGKLAELAVQLFTWVQSQLPGWLAQLAAWGQALVDWIGPMIPPALAALADLGTRLLTWLGEQVGPLAAQLGKWGNEFVAWIVPAATKFLAEWPEMFDKFLTWIGDQAGPLLTQLGQWALAFIQWIVPMIPGFLTALAGIAAALLVFLGETLLVLGKKLGELGLAFVKWIAPQIPPMLRKLGELGLQLGQWVIGTALPDLIAKLVEWGGAFLGFIAKDVLPTLPGKLLALLTAITDWMAKTAVPALLKAAADLGGAILDGMLNGLKTLGSALVNAISEAIRSIHIDIGPFHLSADGFRIDMPSFPEIQLPKLPGMAAGGPVFAGTAYMVGERGPEVFAPSTSGRIIPSMSGYVTPILGGGGRSGGNTYVSVNVTVSGNTLLGDSRSTARELARLIKPELDNIVRSY